MHVRGSIMPEARARGRGQSSCRLAHCPSTCLSLNGELNHFLLHPLLLRGNRSDRKTPSNRHGRVCRVVSRLQQRVAIPLARGKAAMNFMLTFRFQSETRNEAITRFQTTGGRTPKGVQLLGRWTTADLHGGFALLESYDIKAIVEFTLGWSDLLELEIVPLIEDNELREVLDRQEARTEREKHR